MATSEDLSKRLSEIYRQIDDLKASASNEYGQIEQVLSSALEELQTGLEELNSAEEELCQQNEELIEANEILRRQSEMLERAPVFIRDLDDRIITWSRGVEKLYGWTSKEAIGKISHDHFRTEFPAPPKDIKAKVLRDGLWSGELSHTTRDNRQIFVASQWILYKDGSGKPTAIVEVNSDITERKKAEERLERSNQTINEILSSIQDEFYVLDRDWNFVYASKRLTSRIGKEPKDFIGRNFWEMFPKISARFWRRTSAQ